MKINPSFPHDMFKFLHKPIRDQDGVEEEFVERYMKGQQQIWEELVDKILAANQIFDPEKCRADLLPYLKDIVGLTKELDNITQGLSDDDLRKIILLAVPLWKQKGLETGFSNIVRLFTGFNARVFNWFDYRMIVGEKAIGEEQLGEDAWLISNPGVEGSTATGTPLLLMQFEERDLRDGSLYRHNVLPYGSFAFAAGGPYTASENYIYGNGFGMLAEYKDIYDWSNGVSIEGRFKTSKAQTVPLFHWYDADLDKGIRLYIDTTSDEITYAIQDGDVTQTNTIAAGVSLADDDWHHVAWVVDWSEGASGETSLWVDGTRILNESMNASFVKRNIFCFENIHIGMESIYGARYSGSLDGIRVTNDVRWTVANSTIVPPGANFIEYVEEQLDEFQVDVRVVDDGTLDRTLIKRLLNLMRPCSERINILYIDFYEDFEAGKGQYETISGTAYVEKTDEINYLKMPEGSLEHVDVKGSADWTNYLCQQRCIIYEGEEIEVRFMIQDELNYYAFRVNTSTKLAHFEKSVAGVRTALDTPKTIDVEPASLPLYLPGYVYMVSSFKNENTGEVTLKGYIDSNQIFEVNDNTFTKGTFGLYTPTGSTVWCSEAEMFELPLEHERINPNDVF